MSSFVIPTIRTVSDEFTVSAKAPPSKKQKTKATGSKKSTVSLAIDTGCVLHETNLLLRTALVWRIAGLLLTFNVTEVILVEPKKEAAGALEVKNCTEFVETLLSYLEAPPYLRKALFPLNPALRFTSSFPLLAFPHHSTLTTSAQSVRYREGVVEGSEPYVRNKTLVYAGLDKPVRVPGKYPRGTRVTVSLKQVPKKTAKSSLNSDCFEGDVVSSSAPREKGGLYWGYTIRRAQSWKDAVSSCSYKGGYSHVIGIDRTIPSSTGNVFGELQNPKHTLLLCFLSKPGKEQLSVVTHSTNPLPFALASPSYEQCISSALTELCTLRKE
ncbi:DUF171 family protein [Schizosaccharomyces japonicus yFS275]|uniref:DUF171 family protein n=1 Tax=Schizosaccharomyces japonicus (strain yFS275 / FY16936) TaxID=402676 RepID=B6K4J3_SCHJY|nr:DUF171 family protein [Schizosaccharomyces japonicus yFS275]EEB08400.1 DUF171 family protein [Schizosaccharomyces japonicus yFS275]